MADTILHERTVQQVTASSWPAERARMASFAVLVLCLCGWQWRVTGTLGPASGATLALFAGLCVAYGSLFQRLIRPLFDSPAGMAFQFVAGYFVFNSLLFILALCTPFGMALNLGILALLALAGLVMGARRSPAVAAYGDPWAAMAAIVIAGIGATIWCGDAQAPLHILNGNAVFQVWPDTFIHAREISVFAQAHGIGTVQDIKLAGGRAPIYHFASYLSPAAVSVLSGASAMQVYASLQLPLGILLTGLAAYSLMSKLFGCWPGVVAVAAIVLFPDAFQQGFQNRYLSYYFLSQVNLGMLYGIACIALAWMFMLDGCRRANYKTVLLGYAFLALCLFYKAHLFVANSYVLMMFPFVFFTPVRRLWRVGLGILATVIFCAVVAWSQTNPRVPVLRLDGSGIGMYLVQLLQDYEAGWMKNFFSRIFLQEKHGMATQALYAAAMLLLSTFGVWLAALVGVLAKGWRRIPSPFWWLPVIVTGNYLIMALGLASDTHGVGTPDELSNRPLVWAFFVMAAWTAAAACWLWIGDRRPQGKTAAGVACAIILCGIAAAYHAPNLQTFPGRTDRATFVESGAVPQCLVQTAGYLRRASAPGDVVHDSAFDPGFILTALSERQLYVGATTFGGINPDHHARLQDVAALAHLTTAEQVQHFASTRGIDWVVQHPQDAVHWPQSVLGQPAFSCNGYRLYHFVHDVPAPSASALAAVPSNKGN